MPNWSTRFLLPSHSQSTPSPSPSSHRIPDRSRPLPVGPDRLGPATHRSLQTSASVAVFPTPRRTPEHSRSRSQQVHQNSVHSTTNLSSVQPMLSLRKSEGDLTGASQAQARGSEPMPQPIPHQLGGRASVRRPPEAQEMVGWSGKAEVLAC